MMTTAGFIVRMLLTLLTVFGTYNPSGYSYWHWIGMEDAGHWTLKLFVGTILALLIHMHIQATHRSMKLVGATLVGLIHATAVWALWDHGLLDLGDPTTITLTLMSGVAAILGTGFCWSLVRYRLSGQVDSQNVIPP